ncbi:MAG: integrin [Nitrospira sp.]
MRVLILAVLTVATITMQSCGSDEAPEPVPAPLKQLGYLKASNTGAGDWFGTNIALDGDTLVVGARFEDSVATGVNGDQADNSASDSGAVYVFTRSGGGWSQQAYLKASNTEAGDEFGSWVALDGDTLVVGARFEDSAATGVNGDQADNSAPDSGAVYVFTRSGGVWSQQAYLKASNTEAGDWFGATVALDGDTLVVGARFEDSVATGVNGDQADNSAPDSGAVYVFTRSGGVWSQQAYLKASNTEAGDEFGFWVAMDGDTLVAGARFEDSAATGVNGDQADNSAPESGAAYVFTRTEGDWSQQAYLKASNTGAGDLFGNDVAVDGDTLVVGAPSEDSAATGVNGDQADNSAPESGAAYVFTRSGGDWSQQAYLKASNTEAGDEFGFHVALWGDTVLLPAYLEDSAARGINGNQADNSAPDSGAAYVFTRTERDWSQQAYLKASNTGAGDWFGIVAVDRDMLIMAATQEDSATIGINGRQADNSASDSGAVYVFQLE